MPAWERRVIRSAGVWAARTRFTLTWIHWPLRTYCEAYDAEAIENCNSGSVPVAIAGGRCTSYENRCLVARATPGAGTTLEAVSCAGRWLRQRDPRKVS